jgi:lysophospholipase L1-like esterase
VFTRYVAIGDSTTEGLDDPDGRGGYRGWANRLAEAVAQHAPTLRYANLAVRGLRTREIREQQLDRALRMAPDLSTVVSGTNDVLRQRFDIDAFGRDVEYMQRALIAEGATVLTFTLPDLSRVNPIARLVSERVFAMNERLREVSSHTGAIVVDLAAQPVATDARLWSGDRLHANALGHERIAAALAHAIALPGSSADWCTPTARETIANEARWAREYLAPWVMRRLTGRSSADGVVCKRPELAEIG